MLGKVSSFLLVYAVVRTSDVIAIKYQVNQDYSSTNPSNRELDYIY